MEKSLLASLPLIAKADSIASSQQVVSNIVIE
jgi:hypothetical protein